MSRRPEADTPSILVSSFELTSSPSDADREDGTPARISPLGMVGLSALVILTAWMIVRRRLFTAGDDIGYWLGVAGGVAMLIIFLYPLRKHFKFAHKFGRMKFWFWMHMLLGIGGPFLILLHSTFHVGSLNAGVAYYSMLVVAGSGVIGTFFYSRVHEDLYVEELELEEFRTKVRLNQTDVRSRIYFAPSVEELLKDFYFQEIGGESMVGWQVMRSVLWLPIRWRRLYAKCVAELKQPIRDLAKQGQWTKPEYKRREAKALEVVSRFGEAVVSVSQHAAYVRLFALWHVLHIPFVYLLVLSSIVHVVAVHAY